MTEAVFCEEEVKQRALHRSAQSTDPVERLRYQCLARGTASINALARAFRGMDDNRNKRLDINEFLDGVHLLGLNTTQQHANAIFTQLDHDANGTVDLDEFLLALRPPMSSARVKLVEAAFSKLDRTGDGKVTHQDIACAYDVSKNKLFLTGQKTKEQVCELFLKSFEIGGHVDGTVTKQEFLNYYAGVSASIDHDAYFDLMMRNCWKL